MSATRDSRNAKRKRIAIELKRECFHRTFTLAIGLVFSVNALESISYSQNNSGDLPASPWSNRAEAKQPGKSENGVRDSSQRLRQPTASVQPTASGNGRVIELRASEPSRPAPVTLLGPVVPPSTPPKSAVEPQSIRLPPVGKSLQFPKETNQVSQKSDSTDLISSSAPPSHTSTQTKPIETKSDWHRVQAGGLVLDPELESFDEHPAVASSILRNRTEAPGTNRLSDGLPEQIREPEPVGSMPSRMASSMSAVGLAGPIQLHPQRANENTTGEIDVDSIVASTSSRIQPNGPTTETRSNLVTKPVDNATKQPAPGYTVHEAFPIVDDPDATENATIGHAERTIRKPPADDIPMKRIELAQRVSHELLSQSPGALAGPPEALESLPGWQAMERELRQKLDRCDSLLKRGAVLSAREEASQGLIRLYRTMDLHRGNYISEPAFEKALIALREEADFRRLVGRSQAAGVQAVVDTHSTEALKGRPLNTTSPELAAMHYRAYARYQLVAASDGHPWAADLLYAYGKTLEKDAELNSDRSIMFRSQAIVFYQAATQVAPSQIEASNQLGFALIHLDRIDDAYVALASSIKHKPNANAWKNLAEVFRLRGATADAEYALQQATALESEKPRFSPENPEVTELDPTVFAKYSPMPMITSPAQNSNPINNPASVPNGLSTHNSAGKSLFSKIFR